MFSRRTLIKKSFFSLPLLRLFSERQKKVTDTEILDCLVYVSKQFESWKKRCEPKPKIYMSFRFYKAIKERFKVSDEIEIICISTLQIILKENIDWGDGPEYTCWLTNA